MGDNKNEQQPQIDNFAEGWMETSQKSANLASDFFQKQHSMSELPVDIDESAVRAFQDMAFRFASDPASMAKAQLKLWGGMTDVWMKSANSMMGKSPSKASKSTDRRFKGEAWEEDVAFDYIKESYLMVSDWTHNLCNDAKGMSDHDKKKVQFLSRQFSSAISPSNFVLTNPEVLKETIDTGGANLLDGFKNLLGDMEKGQGKLKISMTDNDAFTVGGNIAITPGKVIFRSQLFELIQYSPTTKTVHETPILFVPPWINKFYVMDLQPQNSLIKWVVDQGYTLFVISWINPGPKESHISFADYMSSGVLVAIENVLKITGEKKTNMLGFCIGGILLTTTLAYLAAKGDTRVNTATILATMIDLTDAGEMSVFLDEEQLNSLSNKVTDRGYLEGEEMSGMFNMMRENDLVWSFVINNYLMGKDPVPFDLLYWNADNTRMPAKMIVEYLTGFYRDNAFMNPGRITIDGHKIDVKKIKTPVFMIATKDDHIAPWRSCYAGVREFSGPKNFILGASGHIAGIINSPVKNKYCYWTNSSKKTIDNPDDWYSGAKVNEGSWWTNWEEWLSKNSGNQVPARIPGKIKAKGKGKGKGKVKILCDAPGTYVHVRSDD